MLTHRLERIVAVAVGEGVTESSTRGILRPYEVDDEQPASLVTPEAKVPGDKKAWTTILLVEGKYPPPTSFGEALLRQGFAVLVAANLRCARRVLVDPDVRVDVVLFDHHLPDGTAEDLLSELEELPRQLGVVILADSADDFCAGALELGGVIVPVATPLGVLGGILKTAADGHALATIKRFSRRFKLSDKETEILSRVTAGASPKAIAAEMRCSLQAVYARLAKICARTSCDSYQEVVAKLFQFSCHGLGR
jgi:DNA-binding NarL/FixJ family response regulator